MGIKKNLALHRFLIVDSDWDYYDVKMVKIPGIS
jgi:hypothetical protein